MDPYFALPANAFRAASVVAKASAMPWIICCSSIAPGATMLIGLNGIVYATMTTSDMETRHILTLLEERLDAACRLFGAIDRDGPLFGYIAPDLDRPVPITEYITGHYGESSLDLELILTEAIRFGIGAYITFTADDAMIVRFLFLDPERNTCKKHITVAFCTTRSGDSWIALIVRPNDPCIHAWASGHYFEAETKVDLRHPAKDMVRLVTHFENLVMQGRLHPPVMDLMTWLSSQINLDFATDAYLENVDLWVALK